MRATIVMRWKSLFLLSFELTCIFHVNPLSGALLREHRKHSFKGLLVDSCKARILGVKGSLWSNPASGLTRFPHVGEKRRDFGQLPSVAYLQTEFTFDSMATRTEVLRMTPKRKVRVRHARVKDASSGQNSTSRELFDQLVEAALRLETTRATCITVQVALEGRMADDDVEFARCLRRNVSDPIGSLIEKLSKLVAQLGGVVPEVLK